MRTAVSDRWNEEQNTTRVILTDNKKGGGGGGEWKSSKRIKERGRRMGEREIKWKNSKKEGNGNEEKVTEIWKGGRQEEYVVVKEEAKSL